MVVNKTSVTEGTRATPAVIGYCLRGGSEEGESYLYFVLKDKGLFLTCGHRVPHEVPLR